MPLPNPLAQKSCSYREARVKTRARVPEAGNVKSGPIGDGQPKAMPRPRKHRRISHDRKPAIFKPVGIPLNQLKTIKLSHEELEALRLVDMEDRYQEEAAKQMNVSRSTLQRILNEARYKVVEALT
jgi:predicted DNA-binding protein (UPF0251 family)